MRSVNRTLEDLRDYMQPGVESEPDEADDTWDEANETQEQTNRAWQDAIKAREQANHARDEANQSRDDANRAWRNANCARVEANRARDEANRARDEANRVRDEADRTRAEAAGNQDNALEVARGAHHLYELAKDEANQAWEEANRAREEVIEVTQQSREQYVQLQQRYDTAQEDLRKVQIRLDELAAEVKEASPPASTEGSTSAPAATLEYELEYQQHRRKRILETVQSQISRRHRVRMLSQYSALAKADMYFWETMAEAERGMDGI